VCSSDLYVARRFGRLAYAAQRGGFASAVCTQDGGYTALA
jgi:hypothetical protein